MVQMAVRRSTEKRGMSTVGAEPACRLFVRGAERDQSKKVAKEAAGRHHLCAREDTDNCFYEKHTIARYIFLPGNPREMAEDGRSVDRHLIPRKNQCAMGTDRERFEASTAGDEPACPKGFERKETQWPTYSSRLAKLLEGVCAKARGDTWHRLVQWTSSKQFKSKLNDARQGVYPAHKA